MKLSGEEHRETLSAAYNYAHCLLELQRFEEAKSLMRKMIPVARRVLGDENGTTLKMRSIYAQSLYRDDGATFDDLREAVTTLEEIERTARRVLGGAHPITNGIERELQESRAALRAARASEAMLEGDVNAMREAMAAMAAGDAQEGSKLNTK